MDAVMRRKNCISTQLYIVRLQSLLFFRNAAFTRKSIKCSYQSMFVYNIINMTHFSDALWVGQSITSSISSEVVTNAQLLLINYAIKSVYSDWLSL